MWMLKSSLWWGGSAQCAPALVRERKTVDTPTARRRNEQAKYGNSYSAHTLTWTEFLSLARSILGRTCSTRCSVSAVEHKIKSRIPLQTTCPNTLNQVFFMRLSVAAAFLFFRVFLHWPRYENARADAAKKWVEKGNEIALIATINQRLWCRSADKSSTPSHFNWF